MKVAVVGAAGFIGRHLCRRLAGSDEVEGFDVAVPPELGFPCRELDVLRDAPDLTGADAVVYLSQSPHYRDFAEHGDHLFGVNAHGALRAAMAAVAAGARRLVYASTGSVYAPSFERLAEDSPTRRDDPYALSKLAAEDMLALLHDELSVTCVRLFGVFGPGQQTMLVPAIASRVRGGDPVTLEANPNDPSDGDGLRISLTFVDDVVAVLEALLAADRRWPATLNVAAPEAVSVRHLACTIAEQLSVEPTFEVVDRPRASDFIADIGRLEALLAPRFTDFGEAIQRTLQRTLQRD